MMKLDMVTKDIAGVKVYLADLEFRHEQGAHRHRDESSQSCKEKI